MLFRSREYPLEKLEHLAQEIRQKILTVCMKNGGHLGASLGAVELAISVHRVFDTPKDAVIWDVGHQAYAHKLLTGRWDAFETLRTTNGISGFLSREESNYDVFGAGHSSTSISAGLGIAWAQQQNKQSKTWTVSIIGDGGLTAGLALEALNNVRTVEPERFLVILNDNQMSISPNVGAIPAILASGNAKGFFEHFDLEYVGPVDGHDLTTLMGTLESIRSRPESKPVLLHVLTQKGKGYTPAEEQPASFHGVSPISPKVPGKNNPIPARSFSQAFGEALCALAEKDPKVIAVTAAMSEGTGLLEFARRFPDRLFDVGIAEAHAVTFAAGLATQGFKPVVAIYSTFLQRALDSVIHDVALQNLPVIFAIDRAGIVGADGPTHHGVFDLAYLGAIPNLTLTQPACLADVGLLLSKAIEAKRPFVFRYPRGSGPETLGAIDSDHLRWIRKCEKPKAILVALGPIVSRLHEVCKIVDVAENQVSLISTLYANPIPQSLVVYLNQNPQAKVITIEDGAAHGGFGQSLFSELQSQYINLGFSNEFIPHGSIADLEKIIHHDSKSIKTLLEKFLTQP